MLASEIEWTLHNVATDTLRHTETINQNQHAALIHRYSFSNDITTTTFDSNICLTYRVATKPLAQQYKF